MTSFSPTSHETYPKDGESRRQLRQLCEKRIIPIPELFALLNFDYCEPSYPPNTNKDIQCLNYQIGCEKEQLANAEKILFVVKSILLPRRNSFPRAAIFYLTFLEMILEKLVLQIDRSILYLNDDLASKLYQLEKRQQKRKRYKTNKKNANGICCGTPN